VELAVGDALDRGQGGAVGLNGEHHARFGGLSVEHHRTGAAVAGLAPHMGTGEQELLAEEVDQQGTGLDVGVDGVAVHGQ
jgi:hypothetical protein